MVLEKTLASPLVWKEVQLVHPKGNQSWVFIGRTDVEAETPILWPPDVKSWIIWKHPDAGKDWRQEEEMTEDEMVGWHQQLNGHGFWWTLGVGDGQEGLACCGSWGHKELDMTERLNQLTGWLLWELKILVGGMPGKWGKKCFHLSGSLHVRGLLCQMENAQESAGTIPKPMLP